MSTPPPGSPEAIARGCLCPRIDNRNGLGAFDDDDGRPLYWTRDDCPLHGSGSRWRAGDESEEGEE